MQKTCIMPQSELFSSVFSPFQKLLRIYKTQRIILFYITTDVISAAPPVSAALHAAGSLCGHPGCSPWLAPVTSDHNYGHCQEDKKYFKDLE